MVCAYIDGVLVITKKYLADHLKKLEKVLQKITEAGLKVNEKKRFFGWTETEYLGFWVSNQGVRPLSLKFEAIKKIDVPTKVHDVCRLVGLINDY